MANPYLRCGTARYGRNLCREHRQDKEPRSVAYFRSCLYIRVALWMEDNERRVMKIYLDFDGTVCEFAYPKIGRENFGCMEIVKRLQDNGHHIILNTYRADCNDGTLDQAISFLRDHHKTELNAFDVQPSKISPPHWNVAEAVKSGVLFIDDSASGSPLKKAVNVSSNVVDWDKVEKELIEHGILEDNHG